MRRSFRGHYPPTSEEFEKLWTTGDIIFDTNALLNLFRYSESTRDQLLGLMRDREQQLWLPHQVALEFHRRRRGIAGQQVEAFKKVERALQEAENGLRSAIDGLRRHPALEADALTKALKLSISRMSRELRRARDRHLDAVVGEEAHNKTFDAITEIFDGRVGAAYEPSALARLFEEGAKRYASKVPPGYRDESKEPESKYGDFILWRQMLDRAEAERRPMIFVTDDTKDDWWERVDGKTIGPRAELVDEFYEASGERVHFYVPRQFLDQARQNGVDISASSLNEADTVSQEAPRNLGEAMLAVKSEQAANSLLAPYFSDLATGEQFRNLASVLRLSASSDAAKYLEGIGSIGLAAMAAQWVESGRIGRAATEGLLGGALGQRPLSSFVSEATTGLEDVDDVQSATHEDDELPSDPAD